MRRTSKENLKARGNVEDVLERVSYSDWGFLVRYLTTDRINSSVTSWRGMWSPTCAICFSTQNEYRRPVPPLHRTYCSRPSKGVQGKQVRAEGCIRLLLM